MTEHVLWEWLTSSVESCDPYENLQCIMKHWGFCAMPNLTFFGGKIMHLKCYDYLAIADHYLWHKWSVHDLPHNSVKVSLTFYLLVTKHITTPEILPHHDGAEKEKKKMYLKNQFIDKLLIKHSIIRYDGMYNTWTIILYTSELCCRISEKAL